MSGGWKDMLGTEAEFNIIQRERKDLLDEIHDELYSGILEEDDLDRQELVDEWEAERQEREDIRIKEDLILGKK